MNSTGTSPTMETVPAYQRSRELITALGGERWIVVGSAPGTRADFGATITDEHMGATIIATNDAIEWLRPHAYWIHDRKAVQWWMHKAASTTGMGPLVLTSQRTLDDVPPLREVAHVAFDLPRPFVKCWTPGMLCNPMASGAICAQLAAMHGAKQITLVGMGGYASTPGDPQVDYDSGRLGSDGSIMAYYAPFMRSLIAQTPEIDWITIGRPRWLTAKETLFNLTVKDA